MYGDKGIHNGRLEYLFQFNVFKVMAFSCYKIYKVFMGPKFTLKLI